MTETPSRRQVLAALAATGFSGLAGCSSGDQSDDSGDDDNDQNPTPSERDTTQPMTAAGTTQTATESPCPTPTDPSPEPFVPTADGSFERQQVQGYNPGQGEGTLFRYSGPDWRTTTVSRGSETLKRASTHSEV